MLRSLILALLAVTAGLSAGCSLYDPECGLLDGGGIVATVTDAATGEPVSDAVEVTARDGDTLLRFFRQDAEVYITERSRPGTYAVTVVGDGYAPATATVTVAPIRCGGDTYSETVFVEIALTPVPS